MNTRNVLYVCHNRPNLLPHNKVIILSFLTPSHEGYLKRQISGTIISAREIAPEVKEKARRVYTNLIAKIGAGSNAKKKTLRQTLKNKDDISQWWFHKVSEKDCESELTFRFIIEILMIISIADRFNCEEVTLCGGHKETADVLKYFYKIKKVKCRKKYTLMYLIKGGLFRIKYLFSFLLKWIAIQRVIREIPQGPFDVIFSGFWDWSISKDNKTMRLKDRYFKSLPDKLESKGLKIGWFLWFDPHCWPGYTGRKICSVLDTIKHHGNLVILQKFITITDVIKAILNLKPLFVFLNFLKDKYYREAFKEEGIDFLPLLKAPLIFNFINANMPYMELVYIASKRAFMHYKPKISISFLELLIYSRAFYVGGKNGYTDTVHCAVQHASYSREKTFVLLHPELEYSGYPDSCPMPKPDYIFAMGELGKEIFMESGFPENRIFSTGSSRYEHINSTNIVHKDGLYGGKNILIAAGLDIDLEIEMVDAVCTATKEMTEIKLFLRNHPFARLDKHPDFCIYKDRVTVTARTLEEDMQNADLIIFSYSTVAEEALVRGMPVWQWCSASYNGSVFRDLKVIPLFNSTAGLGESIKKFIANPDLFIPDEKTKKFVLKKCFFYADGKESDRISDCIINKILK